MRRVFAQARKEITQVLRDRLSLGLALLLPVFMLLLMGTAFTFSVTDVPIVVQDFDDSPASRDLIDAFRGSLSFRVVSWPVDEDPERALATNVARAALIVPPHFGREMARGGAASVQLVIDGSDANTAKLVAGYAGGLVSAYNAQTGGAARVQPVTAAFRLWYNPGLDSKKFYGPGMFVLVLTLFPTLLAALAASKEGEEKTILQVYVSSVSANEFLLGKIFGTMAIALTQALILVALLLTYFGMHFAGDPTPFVVSTILYAFCVVSFGTWVGDAIPNQVAAVQAVALGGYLLVFMLSGVIVPIETMPHALQWLSNAVWGTYYTRVMRDALLQGGGWPAMWGNVGAIALFGALFYTLAWLNMRRMQVRS
jgi:ABC-2 type transport system permease protein